MRHAWIAGLVLAGAGCGGSGTPGEADAPPGADAAIDAAPAIGGEVVASGLFRPYGIVVDGAEAYLGANEGDIVRLTLATGAHQAIGTGLGTPASFADGSRVG